MLEIFLNLRLSEAYRNCVYVTYIEPLMSLKVKENIADTYMLQWNSSRKHLK